MNRTIERGRLLRGMALLPFMEELGPNLFRVRGNEEPLYYVNLDGDPVCYCDDSKHAPREGRMCKHEIVCRLYSMEEGVLTAMNDILVNRQQHLAEHTQRTRRTPGCQ